MEARNGDVYALRHEVEFYEEQTNNPVIDALRVLKNQTSKGNNYSSLSKFFGRNRMWELAETQNYKFPLERILNNVSSNDQSVICQGRFSKGIPIFSSVIGRVLWKRGRQGRQLKRKGRKVKMYILQESREEEIFEF